VTVKNAVVCNVAPSNLVELNGRFGVHAAFISRVEDGDHVPPKFRQISIRLHVVTYQKKALLLLKLEFLFDFLIHYKSEISFEKKLRAPV
jgi:hypothetical protein